MEVYDPFTTEERGKFCDTYNCGAAENPLRFHNPECRLWRFARILERIKKGK